MNLGSDTSRITLRNLARDEDGCARFLSQLFSSVGATDEKKRQRPRGISSTSSCNIVGANYSDSNICRRDMSGYLESISIIELLYHRKGIAFDGCDALSNVERERSRIDSFNSFRVYLKPFLFESNNPSTGDPRSS